MDCMPILWTTFRKRERFSLIKAQAAAWNNAGDKKIYAMTFAATANEEGGYRLASLPENPPPHGG